MASNTPAATATKKLETVRIVQIGTGGIGNMHLRLWKETPGVEVVGLFDTNPEAAKKAAEKHGVTKIYASQEEALAEKTADAVMVAAPNRYHAPITIAALQAGKHVICEKPLACRAPEIEQMIAARDRAGKLLMTAQHMRFETRTGALKKYVDAGQLGQVYYGKVTWLRRRFAPTSPGFITASQAVVGPGADIGVHVLDLAMHLLGHPRPVAVSGTAGAPLAKTPGRYNAWGAFDPKQYEVEDFAAGWIRFENGMVLTLEVSWMLNMWEPETIAVELFGDQAGVRWPEMRFIHETDGQLTLGTFESFNREVYDGHKNELVAFADAVRKGGPSPVPAEQSLSVARMLDAIYESAKTGREVRLDA